MRKKEYVRGAFSAVYNILDTENIFFYICNFFQIPESYEEEVDDSTISSYLNFTSKQSGYIQCSAKNVLGYDTQVSSYCVTGRDDMKY